MALAGTESETISVESTADRYSQPILWRQRPDLIVRQQDSGAWIVKDPLSLTYSLLNEQEIAVLRLLDGTRSIRNLLTSLQNGWPDLQLQTADISEFVSQLVQNQLVISTSLQRVSSPSSLINKSRRGLSIGSIFRMQFRLLDPSPWLNSMRPIILRLFSPVTAIVVGVLICTAFLMVILRFEQLAANLPGPWEFFGPDNLILLTLSFIAVKTLHEIGHAFAASRYGAECHDAGIMFMLFTPLLYTNVTDAWILERRSRLMIAAAGMMVEIVLASAATIVWFFAAPGLIKAMMTNVMLLCSVGTVLFNGNPLLRYDGYFLLTDAIGQPNLAQRGSLQVQRFFSWLLMGSGIDDDAGWGNREGWFVLGYGLCSGLYRIGLTFAILLMLAGLFDQWNLRIAGITLMIAAAGSMVLVPAFSMMANLGADLMQHPNRLQKLMRLVLVTSAGLTIFLIPFPRSIVVPAIVEPSGIPVFTTLPGTLSSSARYGQTLRPGDRIAVLEDLSLQRQQTQVAGEVRMLEARVRAMELNRDGQQASQLPEVRSLLETAMKRQQQFAEELKRLTIRSSSSGVFLPPRRVAPSADEQSLSDWYGNPLDRENIGARLNEATLLGYVCDPAEVDFLLSITDEERELLAESQSGEFQLTGNPNSVFRGTIRQVAPLEVDAIPSELTAAGLAVPLQSGAANAEDRRWQAVMRSVVPENSVRPGLYSTGLVRVSVQPQSLFSRFRTFLKRAFRSSPEQYAGIP